jgi:hypothetical protein
VELSPWATTGITIGAEVSQAQPAAIVTGGMWTEMPRGVNLTGAAGGGSIGSGRTGGCGAGCAASCAHRAQWGLWVRPTNGLGSLER